MIKGSLPGSIPTLVLGVLVKHGKKMRAVEIHAQFAPELNISKASVSTALVEMFNKGVIDKKGGKKDMVFWPTGKNLISRNPKNPNWKPKPLQVKPERETVFNFKNKTIPRVKTVKTIADDIELKTELEKTGKKSAPQAPELIKCNDCEWYGPEPGCTDCKYVFPNEKIAA